MKSVHRPIPLSELLSALTSTVVTLVDAPAGEDVITDSVAFMDIDDLTMEMPPGRALPEVYLQVGIGDEDAARWVRDLGERCPAEHRPRVVFSKSVSPRLCAAAHEAGIALVAVHPHARWEMVHALIERITGHGAGPRAVESAPALDTDLFGLAHSVGESTRGLVSIEDAQSRVLAYSADSSAAADEVRRLSVLGRQGPAGYLHWLQREGVFDRLRNTGDVVEVPAQREWNTRRRIAIGIREPGRDGLRSPTVLGTIWVQEAGEPLHTDSVKMLRGAASIAARVIWRTRHAPTTDALLIQRLLGAHGGDVDLAAFAETFGMVADGQAAVVGFARHSSRDEAEAAMHRGTVTLRLHASAFRQDCVTTRIGERLYVLFPEHRSVDRVTSWTRQVIGQIADRSGLTLRAAVAAPVAGLADAARARAEVDRVLDRTAALPAAEPVTTLARSRTTVLLAEILTLIGDHPQLRDPRLDILVDYDTTYSADLRTSLDAYLSHHGDVRTAATELSIHPNTLRYRVRRATQLMGLDLTSPPDRLLLEIQLAVHRHTNAT
ncbi:CdaR family transcriptional regulator [Nocardia sp. BMG51109]|uniref:PucR family transcriptional regulator n=1 Tax=Nocardia sp. BMG51109 TaxID=1056816 RepID=UPI000688E0EB|nr:helix-turn-helix domain-containing protein [Nocardia sp. BMG51109]